MSKPTIHLLITHPRIDPMSISAQLGIEPSLMQKSGDPVVTPHGKKVGGKYQITKWQHRIEIDNETNWNNALAILIKKLVDQTDFFTMIRSEGGKTSIFVAATNVPHAALEVSPEMLNTMAGAQVHFGFDIFSTAE